MTKRKEYDCKYKRKYGRTILEIAEEVGCSLSSISKYFMKNDLRDDEDGFWILPCSDCGWQGNCSYTEECFNAVKSGKGLGRFEKKEDTIKGMIRVFEERKECQDLKTQ